MPRFSERVGLTTPKNIQINDMDDDLRNSLWNMVCRVYEEFGREGYGYWCSIADCLAFVFFKILIDEVPSNQGRAKNWIKNCFDQMAWYEVYDFIEYVVANHERIAIGLHRNKITENPHPIKKDQIIEYFNVFLKRELSGFRFISGVLSPITNETEIQEIESAVESARDRGFQGVQTHLTSALDMLGKRPEPDYRNSIKESISAVESVAKLISGEKAGGLEAPLRKLSEKTYIHPALREGFIKIYGYTSDDDGIRHPILEDANAGFDEAKFMLVSCSAFVNFLISKADTAGLFDAD